MAWCITKSKRLDSSGDTAKNLGNTAGMLVNVAGSCRVASTYCICLNVLFSHRLSSDNHNPKIPTTLPISSNLASKPADIFRTQRNEREGPYIMLGLQMIDVCIAATPCFEDRDTDSLSHTQTPQMKEKIGRHNVIVSDDSCPYR